MKITSSSKGVSIVNVDVFNIHRHGFGCMHKYVYIYIYTHTHIYMHMHIHIYIYIYIYILPIRINIYFGTYLISTDVPTLQQYAKFTLSSIDTYMHTHRLDCLRSTIGCWHLVN